MTMPWVNLVDPMTRQPLLLTSSNSDARFGTLSSGNGSHKWPVVLGISYLRFDRLELAEKVSSLIDKHDFVEALALLLTDTDDFAPLTPTLSDCRVLSKRLLNRDENPLAVDVMQTLQFGAVANYFAVRGLAPTFFSGVGLLKAGVIPDRPLVEVGCGVGHFLYWLQIRNIEVLGVDTVFSKLCLANRYLGIHAEQLICAAAGKSELPFNTNGATNIFCHDVFYFIEDKFGAIADFRRLAGKQGSVMVGHAHLATADHGIVSGHPLGLESYREIALSDAHFFDDESLVIFDPDVIAKPLNIPTSAEAISFVEGNLADGVSNWWVVSDEMLHVPMEICWSFENGHTKMEWPTEAFAKEYQASSYLSSELNPFELLPFRGDVHSLRVHPSLAVPTPFFAIGVRPLKWGVIGAGWIAEDYFIPSFAFTPHASLVAVCDLNTERLDVFASVVGLKLFEDWREMLQKCDLDAVYIATPNFLHAEIFEAIAQLGLRILCEKPIATNLDDLARIENCAIKFNGRFQTAFDQRYHPAHEQLKRRLKENILGTVTQIRIHYACWVDDDWQKVKATLNWRTNLMQAGGGAGFDLLPHCLDLLLMLTDDTIDSTHLMYQGLVHGYSANHLIDDGAIMAVKTKKGVLASIHVGYNCPENQPRRRIEIMGTRGYVIANNTMGQDAGGELTWHIDGEKTCDIFPNGKESGPFVRQLDAICRLWLRSDTPKYPFDRDIELAKHLIISDVTAKNTSNANYQRT